ncbi:hypothetical protein [Comamonas sp.]|uniref:hypothetical protein n=1 Tax=Comamonas sp. TaxID=34028 RepID=UPI003A8F3D95
MHQSLIAIKLAIHLSAVAPLQAAHISPNDYRAEVEYELFQPKQPLSTDYQA